MRLKFLTIDEIDGVEKEEFKDIYLDPSKITAWYLPNQYDEILTLNIFFDGQILTVIYNDELRKYLDENLTYNKYETK